MTYIQPGTDRLVRGASVVLAGGLKTKQCDNDIGAAWEVG
jgi:hypothetical protein